MVTQQLEVRNSLLISIPLQTHLYYTHTFSWNKPCYCVVNKLHKFVDHSQICQEAIIIRDLCIEYDDGYFNVLDSEQMCHMIEYLRTI